MIFGLIMAGALAVQAVGDDTTPNTPNLELTCQKEAARRWDDGTSDAATIARIVEVQCSANLRAIAMEQAKANGFADNPVGVQTMIDKLEEVYTVLAIKDVLQERIDRRVLHKGP